MISKQETEHIAKLARLGLKEKEIEKFQEELSSILDYIEKMNKADVSGIEPTSHSIKVENIMRKDEGFSFGSEKELLDLAPCKENGHVKVKSILK